MAEVRLPDFRITPTTIALGESVDWGVRDAPELWKQTKGEGVRVAILDNGCDLSHPDLDGQIKSTRVFYGRGWEAGTHGTPVATMIVGNDNGTGIIGPAPKAEAHVGQIMVGMGGPITAMIDGIYWSADEVKAHVCNISAGFPVANQDVLKAIKHAMGKGVLFCVAAGNDGPRPNSVNYPAVWTGGIGAYRRDGVVSNFSSRGKQVICVLPGEGVLAGTPGGGHALHDGTSFGAPGFAGWTCLAVAKHLKYGGDTPLDNQRSLIDHAKEAVEDAGPAGHDPAYGWGRFVPKSFVGPPPVEKPPHTDEPAVERYLVADLFWRYELWRRRA